MSDKKSLEQQLKQQILDLESRLSQSQSEKQNTEQKLSGDIDLIHKQLLGKTGYFHFRQEFSVCLLFI